MSTVLLKNARGALKRKISAPNSDPAQDIGAGEIVAGRGRCTKMQLGSVSGHPMVRNSSQNSEPRARICNREIPETVPADGWYHLAPFGEHKSVRIEGEKETPAIQVCDMESFRRQKAHFDVLKAEPGFRGQRFDYDHLSWQSGGSTEASAYCMDMEIRGTGTDENDGLWVKLDLTPTAARKVKDREFCYLSQESLVEDLDPAPDGMPRIRATIPTGGALTNKPALPVRAMNRENQLLSDPPSDEPRKNKAEEAATKKEKNTMKTIAVALGLPEDATEADILSKIKGLTEAAQKLPEVQNALKTLADADLDRRATAFADEHKARITNRESAIAMFRKDPEGAEAWASTFLAPAGAAPRSLNSKSTKEPELNADAKKTAVSARVRNRAREIQREQGGAWSVAFNAAKDEIGQE